MSSASVLYYGRRSRSSRPFLDLTSSSSSSSSDPRSSSHHQPHRHRRCSNSDSYRLHRLSKVDDADHICPPPLLLHSSFISPPPERESLQRGCVGESSTRDINSRETVCDLSRRYCGNNRLPGSVLLAKERLLQRLRGDSVSGDRQSRETLPHSHYHDFWVIHADWETNASWNPSTSDPILIEPLSEIHHQSTPEELKKKPLGLTKETLSQLHREVFIDHQNESTRLKSKASNDCSICLENFVEGNELVSLPCGHRFHTSCLYPWLQTCGDCPNCRYCIMLAS